MSEQTLINLMQQSVIQSSDRLYAAKKSDDGWKGVSFREMRDNVLALAAFFRTKGFNDGDKLAILADGSPNWINAEFGASFAKMVAVPLSYKLLPSEVLFRVDHSETSIIALSSFTQKLGLSIIGQTSRAIKVLWLDNNKEEAIEAATHAGLARDNLIFIEDAVKEGHDILKDRKQLEAINKISNSVREDDLAIITYSSGTSGNPKGVMLSHKNVYSDAVGSGKMFYSPLNQYKTLLIVPCDHIMGHVAGILFGLTKGVSVHFADSRGGQAGMVKNIPLNLSEVKPDFIIAVPALVNNFMKKIYMNIKAKGKTVSKLFDKAVAAGVKIYGNGYTRVTFGTKFLNFFPWFFLGKLLFFPKIKKSLPIGFIVGGGAFFDRKIEEFFASIGIPLYQGYGLSEASAGVSSNLQTIKLHKIGTVGKIFPFMESSIIDDHGQSLGSGNIGELTIKGSNIMMGYYKNPEETSKTLVDGVLHTGDMAMIDKDGFLSIIGRGKAVLISKDGEKYSPEGMETAITSETDIVSQVLLHCEHNAYVTALIALNKEALSSLIKEHFGKTVSIDTAIDFVTKEVFSYKNSSSYTFSKEWQPNTYSLVHKDFEMNSTFKIVRFKAFETYKEEIDFMYTPEGSKPNNIRNQIVLRALLRESGIEVSE